MAWNAVVMSESDMVTTGHIPPPHEQALLRSVRLDVIFGRGERLDCSWAYELCSPFWRLYVNREAGAELEIEGRRISLLPETIYLLPAGLRFTTRLARGVKSVWQDYLHFEVAGFPPALLRRMFPAPVMLPKNSELLAALASWRESFADRSGEELVRRLRSLALVHSAFALGCSLASAEGRAVWAAWLALPPVVSPALSRIELRPEAPPGNEKLAALCGLGTRQFLRRFSEAVGLSPGQYALERRVALAAEALARGPEPVEVIAARLGFADRFHFSKTFRARVGMPPVAYRRMHGVPAQVVRPAG